MLTYFTDAKTNESVAVNPDHVVVVLSVKEENPETKEQQTFTLINLLTGNVVVKESQLDVVGVLNGAK